MIKRSNGQMCSKIIFLGIIIILLSNPLYVQSSTADNINVLVIYSSEDGEVDEHQRLLDLLIGHFTSSITFLSSTEVEANDLSGVTHLIYYGQVSEKLSSTLIDSLHSYKGPILGIGHNVEQITSHFSYIDTTESKIVNDVVIKRDTTNTVKLDSHPIMEISTDNDDVESLVESVHEDVHYPLLIKNKDTYYYATPNLFPPVSNFLADELHTFFDSLHKPSTSALLRLEDVHPRTDHEELEAIANFLTDKNIPYMVSVTPVYVNQQTEEEYHLWEAPNLVETLKDMQKSGASIVLHGYTDQYQDGQTGDGFEFWDVDKNMPVMEEPGSRELIEIEKQSLSEVENRNESAYIEERIKKGIKELVEYDIYPIAFEAPHYAVSQNGYQVISKFFSTYVGQVQLTDEDWRIMTESPYITTPDFLNGMKLVPETIRYIRYDDPTSIQDIKKRIDEFTIVRDGIIGGFYHPFLGLEGLKDLVREMEEIPNLEWIDLSEMEHKVKVDQEMYTIKNGNVITPDIEEKTKKEKSSLFENYLNQVSSTNILWVSIGAGFILILVLINYLLLGRTEKNL
ncbi:DUF2334 domain-containing protein [Gracilibacillus sp. D59]|uniref:DUF2334 domain-containing protein n=1 Tax=Gracilibacillus sp. D59 TaxID=3457434 RepID=UPI003FCD9852